MLGMWEVDDPGSWPNERLELLDVDHGCCCRFTRGGACANWAVKNAIERQKRVVLVVEIEASVLSGNRGCQQADTNAA
jgi:hypothetical protein